MLTLLNFYDKYVIYAKYLLILFLFWLSINTGSKYIEINNLYENLTDNTINLFRSILPYFILFYLIAFKNKNYQNRNIKFDYFFIFFGLYGLFQIIGLLYQFKNLNEHYWVVCLFSTLLFYNLLINKKDDKLINFIFCFNILFISLVFFIFIFFTFKENILSTNLLYNSLAFNIIYNTEQFPRSSGLSRMALILFIFLNSFYLSSISLFKNKTYLLFLNSILISVIFLLQSRGIILSFILIFLLFLITFKIENKLKYLIFVIIFPILIFISYPNLKNILIQKYEIKNTATIYGTSRLSTGINNAQKNIRFKSFEINLRDNILTTEGDKDKGFANKFSSISNNRVSAWNFLLQMFFNKELNDQLKNNLEKTGYNLDSFEKMRRKNIFTGLGPQADRHLMYNKSKIAESPAILGPYGHNASNATIYSLICSGIMGLICFITINIIVLIKILKILIYNFKFKHLVEFPILSSSIFSVLFLQFRSLFENSFSVFGVDMLIFIISYSVIQSAYGKIKN